MFPYPPGDAGEAALWTEDGWENNSGSHPTHNPEGEVVWQTETRVMLKPSGKTATGAMTSYIVKAQAWGEHFHDGTEEVWPLAPQSVQIRGVTLTPVTNADDSVWGVALLTVPAGVNTEITPKAAGVANIAFGPGAMELVKTKEDWQSDVRQEINQDSGVVIGNYLAGNGFMNNRANIKAIYAFYQKLFVNQTNFMWAGLAKLAGAPVYAGLSDAEQVSIFLTNLVTLNELDLALATNGVAFIHTFQQDADRHEHRHFERPGVAV